MTAWLGDIDVRVESLCSRGDGRIASGWMEFPWGGEMMWRSMTESADAAWDVTFEPHESEDDGTLAPIARDHVLLIIQALMAAELHHAPSRCPGLVRVDVWTDPETR